MGINSLWQFVAAQGKTGGVPVSAIKPNFRIIDKLRGQSVVIDASIMYVSVLYTVCVCGLPRSTCVVHAGTAQSVQVIARETTWLPSNKQA
jgi:hypothetical protein